MQQYLLMTLFISTMTVHAQQTNYHFRHTLPSSAKPEEIWKIWIDVDNWRAWDTGIKEASLREVFQNGAKGVLIPDKGPKSTFIIADVVTNNSYRFKTKIPFGWIIVYRYIEQIKDVTYFTHDVKFTGLLKKIIGKNTGKRYREMLPAVMQNIKTIAEKSR